MKIHGGSGKPQGVLNKGTAKQPSPTHGGTALRKGQLKQVATPAKRQSRMSTSYHGTK